MPGKSRLIFCAVALAIVPGAVEARSDALAGGSQARSEMNARSDDSAYYPGRRSFYGYPRHRSIGGGGDDGGSLGPRPYVSDERSPDNDRYYGSPYYGTNYGAPYFGGGYYDGGIYYRERRD